MSRLPLAEYPAIRFPGTGASLRRAANGNSLRTTFEQVRLRTLAWLSRLTISGTNMVPNMAEGDRFPEM
jgi:hypothetical protein